MSPSMLELLQRLEASDPRRGLYFLEDFASPPALVPYVEFPARVAAAAEHFRARGVRPGEQVVFPFDTSAEILFAFLGLMELGAVPLSVKPFLLSTPREPYQAFLERVARRYGARWLLDVPGLESLALPLERVGLPPAGALRPGARLREVAPGELAFVQFSSGSTSFPKGVPVLHGNLVGNLLAIQAHNESRVEDRTASWLPLYHDMGLIGCIASVVGGHDFYLAQPAEFLMDPLGWFGLLSARKVTGVVIPNFAIDYALRALREAGPEALAGLDLSSLRGIYLGSEPINIPNLQAFLDLLAPSGLRPDVFRPCYGMAEAVLMVTSVAPGTPPRVVAGPNGQQAISVGWPLAGFELRLRAEDGRVCGEGELGEVELRGGTLAPEYYQSGTPLAGEDGFFATGDLGFLKDGELFITGRLNDRIKVNGQSFFSADFEQAVERLPFIRAGRSVVLQVQARVVVLAEVNHPSALERLEDSRRRVCQAVLAGVGVAVQPEDVRFIRYGQLEKTSSGKLRRRAMAEAYAQGRIRAVTPLELRADLLRMRTQRLFYGSVLTARKRGRRWMTSGRLALEAGFRRLRPGTERPRS